MRKEQLKVGNKVRNYNKKDTALYTITKQEEGKWILIGDNQTVKSVSESSALKNFKLVEGAALEVAVTIEENQPEAIEEVKEPEIKKKGISKPGKIGESNLVTSASLAQDLGITPQDLRRILRRNKVEKPEIGWKWQKSSEELKDIRSILEGVQEKRMDKKRIRA